MIRLRMDLKRLRCIPCECDFAMTNSDVAARGASIGLRLEFAF